MLQPSTETWCISMFAYLIFFFDRNTSRSILDEELGVYVLNKTHLNWVSVMS